MTTLVRFAAPINGSNDVWEDAGSLTHTLTLSAPSTQTVTVTVRGPAGGSTGYAGSADFFWAADKVITFAPGQTTATFTAAINDDSLYEGNETYLFEIISATGAQIDLSSYSAGHLVGQIIDNDQPLTNNAPVVANGIADQSSPEDSVWNFTIPTNAFSDVDVAYSDFIVF